MRPAHMAVPLFGFKDLVGFVENIKRGFHRNLTRKIKSDCVHGTKLDIQAKTHTYTLMFSGRKPSSFPDDSQVKYHIQIYKQKFWSFLFSKI